MRGPNPRKSVTAGFMAPSPVVSQPRQPVNRRCVDIRGQGREAALESTQVDQRGEGRGARALRGATMAQAPSLDFGRDPAENRPFSSGRRLGISAGVRVITRDPAFDGDHGSAPSLDRRAFAYLLRCGEQA